MRVAGLILVALLLSSAARADDPPQANPDYSRQTLLRLVHESNPALGPLLPWASTRFSLLGTQIEIPWGPLPELSGTGFHTTTELPNPLALMHVDLPMMP